VEAAIFLEPRVLDLVEAGAQTLFPGADDAIVFRLRNLERSLFGMASAAKKKRAEHARRSARLKA